MRWSSTISPTVIFRFLQRINIEKAARILRAACIVATFVGVYPGGLVLEPVFADGLGCWNAVLDHIAKAPLKRRRV